MSVKNREIGEKLAKIKKRENLAQIKQEGYKIISIDLSGITSTNLKNLHVDLGGRIEQIENDTDFLMSKFSSGNLSSGDTDMEKVATRLISGTMLGAYNAVNPKIYFNLNIILVEKSGKKCKK